MVELMKIRKKLTLGYISITVLMAAIGYLSSSISQQALKEAIGKHSVSLAQQILDNIDHTLNNRIENLLSASRDPDLQQTLEKSNAYFSQMENRDNFIRQQDRSWTTGNDQNIDTFIDQLCHNGLAMELKAVMMFYQLNHGYSVFPEIFVTNRYGAIIATTGKTTDYYQADEEWYQLAKKQENFWVGNIEYDQSTATYACSLVINLHDTAGQFSGLIKIIWNIEEIINIVRNAEKQVVHENQTTQQFILVNRENHLIYSTNGPSSLEQLPPATLVNLDLPHEQSYFITETNNPPGEKLVSYAHSRGYRHFPGMDWILLITCDTRDAFAPVTRLKEIALICFLAALVLIFFLGNFLTRLITQPITQLIEATQQIGRGKANISENIKSTEEFHALAVELQKKNKQLNQEINERKDAQQQLTQAAFYDKLTGLANRALFMDRLNRVIQKTKRKKDRMFGLLYLDLDRFKSINDSLGHHFGDELLIEAAQRIKACTRAVDTAARLGGDEFTILLDEISSFSDATDVADRINKAFKEPIVLRGENIFTSASIGIVVCTTGDVSANDLLRNADTAMYRAKEMGKAGYQIFDVSLQQKVQLRLELEQALRTALDEEQYVLFYQPIIALDTGKLEGFEALVRWEHPTQGLVPPIEFIGLCEETGLIVPLSHWVLRRACEQTLQWQQQFPEFTDLSISVNLSTKQLLQPDITDQIERIIKETGIEPSHLNLEITESLLMEDVEATTAVLNYLKEIGIGLDIDDFGTGYSSLSYLHRFPFDTLKVDRSFVDQMLEDDSCANIVRSIVLMAKNLNLNITAEGIETLSQLHELRDLGCHFGQGYLFSKPLSQTDAEEILKHPAHWLDKIISSEAPAIE